jgi:hypothetical protein
MEEDLHYEITENSTKCYAVYLSQKTSENYIQNLYFNVHFKMRGKYAEKEL